MNPEVQKQFYKDVIENVINGSREIFLENDVHEDVLELLKSTWEEKLLATRPQKVGPQTSSSSVSLTNDVVPTKIIIPQSSQEITLNIPRYALGGNKFLEVLTNELLSAVANLPQDLATSVIQQHVNVALSNSKRQNEIAQVDGSYNSSSEEEDPLTDEDEVLETKDDGTPINSDDDITDENTDFDTENIILCQYNQVVRRFNKWKFCFKSGIMNLNGNEYVFDCAIGMAEW